MAIVASAKQTLTRKYGPLPGWAWVGILAGGTFLYLRYRNAQAAQAADDGSVPTDGTGGDITPGGTGAGGGVRNIFYGIRKCPPGYRQHGHKCVPKPCPRGYVRAGRRCVRKAKGNVKGGKLIPAMAAASGPVALRPAYTYSPISKVGGAKVH